MQIRPALPAAATRLRAQSVQPDAEELFGERDRHDRVILTGATLAGSAVGSVALGLGTSRLPVLQGLVSGVNGFVAGAALGAAGGAVASTLCLSKPGQSGRVGLALVGGAAGGLIGGIGGAVLGSFLGNGAGNLVGYAAGAVVGGALSFSLARKHLL